MACRVGKGPSRRTGLLARTVMRLCPRCPTSSFDRVGKVARGQCTMSSAAAGAFAHPTMLHTIYAEQDDRQVGRTTMLASPRHLLTGPPSLALPASAAPPGLSAFVHIANIGPTPFPLPELYNLDFAQVEACAKAVAENADIAIGVKVRMSENVIARNGAEPLRRAIKACEMAGTGGRVMAHIGGFKNVPLMIQILHLLRPGDLLTPASSGAPHLAR